MQFFKQLFSSSSSNSFDQQLRNVLGFKPGKLLLYSTALSHRSVKETAEANNERLEYLDPEAQRCFAIAMNELETAQMYAVKGIAKGLKK